MGLPARQQRALDEIESALEVRYPQLSAMFATFTRLTGGQRPVSSERLPRRSQARWRRGLLPLVPAAAVMAFLAGLLITVAVGGPPACASGRSAREPLSVSCPAPPSPGQVGPAGYIVFPGVPDRPDLRQAGG